MVKLANRYPFGQSIECSVVFADKSGVVADPEEVSFRWKGPDDTVQHYEYGTDEEIVRDSTGRYHVVIDAAASGEWWYGFFGSGSALVSDETRFMVKETELELPEEPEEPEE